MTAERSQSLGPEVGPKTITMRSDLFYVMGVGMILDFHYFNYLSLNDFDYVSTENKNKRETRHK